MPGMRYWNSSVTTSQKVFVDAMAAAMFGFNGTAYSSPDEKNTLHTVTAVRQNRRTD